VDFAGRRVDRQVEVPERRALRWSAEATQDRPDASDQFPRLEWLDDIVVGAELQPATLSMTSSRAVSMITGTLDPAPRSVRRTSNPTGGQHDVENEQIGPRLFGDRNGRVAVRCRQDFVSVSLEVSTHELDDMSFVVNDQYSTRHSTHHRGTAGPRKARRPVRLLSEAKVGRLRGIRCRRRRRCPFRCRRRLLDRRRPPRLACRRAWSC